MTKKKSQSTTAILPRNFLFLFRRFGDDATITETRRPRRRTGIRIKELKLRLAYVRTYNAQSGRESIIELEHFYSIMIRFGYGPLIFPAKRMEEKRLFEPI